MGDMIKCNKSELFKLNLALHDLVPPSQGAHDYRMEIAVSDRQYIYLFCSELAVLMWNVGSCNLVRFYPKM
jgi:hypothetical protein